MTKYIMRYYNIQCLYLDGKERVHLNRKSVSISAAVEQEIVMYPLTQKEEAPQHVSIVRCVLASYGHSPGIVRTLPSVPIKTVLLWSRRVFGLNRRQLIMLPSTFPGSPEQKNSLMFCLTSNSCS